MRLKKIDETGKPYKIFAEHLESAAINQFIETMQQEPVIQGALMADSHSGYTVPIGCVVAVKNHIYPSFVGYDLSCGMCAIQTTFSKEAVQVYAQDIFKRIYEVLPVGFNHQKRSMNWHRDDQPVHTDFADKVLRDGGLKQLGTLGSGNHFVEIGYDESDVVWIVIHSGSRNLGHTIASHYMALAAKHHKAKEGFYPLHQQSKEGRDYLLDLNFATAFALENRLCILASVLSAIRKHASGDADYSTLINRSHNHVEYKMMPINGSPAHAQGVWVHRKGATHAEEGMMGVIPCNIAHGSYIVRGKGNPDSLFSSSHGCGRVMGRAQAKKTLSHEDFVKDMQTHNIVSRTDEGILDEAPLAYKNPEEVMRMQEDLVEVVAHITPVINIKG